MWDTTLYTHILQQENLIYVRSLSFFPYDSHDLESFWRASEARRAVKGEPCERKEEKKRARTLPAQLAGWLAAFVGTDGKATPTGL